MSKILTKAFAAVISVSIAAQLAVIPSLAEGDGGITTFSDIAEIAGNAEMKAYGKSLQASGVTAVKATVPEGGGTTYYVAPDGNDENNGTSEQTPWASIEKVNDQTFQPGDRILFKAGGEWTAPVSDGTLGTDIDDDQDGRPDVWLFPKGSGTKENPIVIGAYGEGALPKLIGAANVNSVLAIKDEEYWDISNLDISNKNSGFNYSSSSADNAKLMGDLRGIDIYGQSFNNNQGGAINGYNLHDLYVHDVTGYVYWGGRPLDRNFFGVFGMMGQDASKRTGGIVFEVWKPTTGKDNPITFNDIIMENNVIWNTSFGGITVKQWEGDGHEEIDLNGFHVDAVAATNEAWGKRENAVKNEDGQYIAEGWQPHTNIEIKNNFVSQKGLIYGCNTIRVASVRGALIEHNVCDYSGTCAVELDYLDDGVVQYNEIYGTEKKMGGADNNAIDTDYRTTNCLIQYNYVYNNGDGLLLCGRDFSTAIYRYNIVANSDPNEHYVAVDGDSGYNYLYNNLFYNNIQQSRFNYITDNGEPSRSMTSGNPLYVYNNIFYNACDTSTDVSILDTPAVIDYDSNSYYGSGINVPASDDNAILDKPYFVGDADSITISDTEDIDLGIFKLSDKSPLINSGREIDIPSDFKGAYVDKYIGTSISSPDIGVDEYALTEGKGIIRGRVIDEYGDAVSGATVTASAEDTELSSVNSYEIKVTDADLSDNTAKITVINNLDESKNSAVILAVYDNGVLVTADVKDSITLHQSETVSVEFENINTDGTANPEAKIMLWDSLNGMVPLCDTTDLKADEPDEPTAITAATDKNGYYSFGEIEEGAYTVQAKKNGYIDSAAQTETAASKSVTTAGTIVMESSLTDGTIEGTVTCAGVPVTGVTVSASTDGSEEYTATTNEEGTYSLTAPAASGYTLTISGEGYKSQSRSGIVVQKGKTITGANFGIQSAAAEVHTYGIFDNFDDYNIGSLSSDKWATTGTGSAIVTDGEGDNKYLKISKSGNNSYGVYNTNDANLGVTSGNDSGIITIGARVMRTTGNSAQFNMFSYNSSGWRSSTPLSSTNPSATFAMSNGNTFSHYLDANGASSTVNAGTYTTTDGDWHQIWIVVNLKTHTYDFYYDNTDAPVIINLPLRDTTRKTILDKFLFYTNSSGNADLCLDYFYACTGVQLDESNVPYPVYDGIGVGSISGTVSDSNGVLSSAAVTLTKDSYSVNATTDTNGGYSFTNVPSAKGYTITIEKDGYRSRTITDVNVSNGGEVTVNATLQTNETVYLINEDFNNYNTGSFTTNSTWTVYGTAGTARTVEIADDTENAGNKYLKLEKITTDNVAFGVYNTANLNISGTVTIEARVKRTKDAGQYNQFSMYSFNSSKFNATNPTGGNTTLTFYMIGNKISTHTASTAEVMSYETNKWYDLKIVADFDTGKFDFYVDDIKKLENQSFKNNDIALDKFLIYSNAATGSSDLFVDYFRVYQ